MRVLFTTTPLDGHVRPLLPLARRAPRARARGRLRHARELARAHRGGGIPGVRGRHVPCRGAPPARAVPGRDRGHPAAGTAPAHLSAALRPGSCAAEAAGPSPNGLRSGDRTCSSGRAATSPAPVAAAALGVPAVNHSFGAMVPLAALRAGRGGGARRSGVRSASSSRRRTAARSRASTSTPVRRRFAWEEPPGEAVLLGPASTPATGPPPWLRRARPAPRLRDARNGLQRPGGAPSDCWRGSTRCPAPSSRPGGTSTRRPSARCRPSVRVERFVPQEDVLPACAAAVVHGGSGTTLAALAHGLPLVLVPQGADQFENAARVEAAGAARRRPPGRADGRDGARGVAARARRAVVRRFRQAGRSRDRRDARRRRGGSARRGARRPRLEARCGMWRAVGVFQTKPGRSGVRGPGWLPA